jgi:hypothetical protein
MLKAGRVAAQSPDQPPGSIRPVLATAANMAWNDDED